MEYQAGQGLELRGVRRMLSCDVVTLHSLHTTSAPAKL